jgi:hypothetical protein
MWYEGKTPEELKRWYFDYEDSIHQKYEQEYFDYHDEMDGAGEIKRLTEEQYDIAEYYKQITGKEITQK